MLEGDLRAPLLQTIVTLSPFHSSFSPSNCRTCTHTTFSLFSALSHLLFFSLFSLQFSFQALPRTLFIGKPSEGISGFIHILLIFMNWQIYFYLHFLEFTHHKFSVSVATNIFLFLWLSIPLPAETLLLSLLTKTDLPIW